MKKIQILLSLMILSGSCKSLFAQQITRRDVKNTDAKAIHFLFEPNGGIGGSDGILLAGDLRKGTKLLYKGVPYTVIEFQHVKPAKGGAYMVTKMKNLLTGLVHEETFRSEEKLETPNLEYKGMLFVYEHENLYEFIDQESYDQITFDKNQVSEVVGFLKEQTVYNVLFFNEKPIAVNAPLFMELAVRETAPGVKGDTAQGGGTKPATLETGLTLQVPLFVNEGDIIKVDTRESTYIERIDKKK